MGRHVIHTFVYRICTVKSSLLFVHCWDMPIPYDLAWDLHSSKEFRIVYRYWKDMRRSTSPFPAYLQPDVWLIDCYCLLIICCNLKNLHFTRGKRLMPFLAIPFLLMVTWNHPIIAVQIYRMLLVQKSRDIKWRDVLNVVMNIIYFFHTLRHHHQPATKYQPTN